MLHLAENGGPPSNAKVVEQANALFLNSELLLSLVLRLAAQSRALDSGSEALLAKLEKLVAIES